MKKKILKIEILELKGRNGYWILGTTFTETTGIKGWYIFEEMVVEF